MNGGVIFPVYAACVSLPLNEQSANMSAEVYCICVVF